MMGWTQTSQGDDMAAEPCPRVDADGKCSIFCHNINLTYFGALTHSTRRTYRKPYPLFIIFLLLVHCGDKPNELQRNWWPRSAIFPELPAGSQSVNNRESRTRLITNNRHRHWTRREAMWVAENQQLPSRTICEKVTEVAMKENGTWPTIMYHARSRRCHWSGEYPDHLFLTGWDWKLGKSQRLFNKQKLLSQQSK